MRTWYKLVSASLVLMALLTLSGSLALCAPESAGSREAMNCPPDCPMMAHMSPGHQGMEMKAENSGPCCTISSSKPAPVTESTTVAPFVVAEPLVTVAGLGAAVGSSFTVDETDASPPPLNGSQALLCTFLI